MKRKIIMTAIVVFCFLLSICPVFGEQQDTQEIIDQYNSLSRKLPEFILNVIGNEIIILNVEMDDGSVKIIGVKTENGIINEFQDEPYQDSTLAVYISEKILEEISSSSDPVSLVKNAWGKEIRFEGLSIKGSFKSFFMNIGVRLWSLFQPSD